MKFTKLFAALFALSLFSTPTFAEGTCNKAKTEKKAKKEVDVEKVKKDIAKFEKKLKKAKKEKDKAKFQKKIDKLKALLPEEGEAEKGKKKKKKKK